MRKDKIYKLFRTRDLDTVTGTRRTVYDIVVGSDIKDGEIKVILEYAVKEFAKKREVDALSVRLFLKDTNLPYAIANWAHYGEWSKTERRKPKPIFKTSITIYPEHRLKESSKTKRYRLSMEQRKMIYHEVVQSQNKAGSLGKQVFIDQQIISGLLIKWTYWMNCNNKKSSVYTSDFVVYVELNEKIK